MKGAAGGAAPALELLPRPRRLEDLGPGPRVEDCVIQTAPDRTLPPEGFTLEVTESGGARIARADDAGLGHARARTGTVLRSSDRLLDLDLEGTGGP